MCLSWENGLRWGEVKWYHDLTAGHGPGVPEAIARRVRRFLVFRKQIDRLQEAVTGAGGETTTSRSKMKRDIIDTLSGHFRCLDEQVTCSRVKPFLPSLLLPTLQVRIPTPITVHLDHCPECAEDLEALRDLGLSPEQLERLEQLYHGPAAQDRRLCRKARSKIGAFVRGSLDGIEAELLDHLCTCARCRSHVYHSRQKLLENEADSESRSSGPEDDITAAELFDYAVPYGRTSGGAQPAGDAPMQTGQAFLKMIQELDETIYGIAERTDSGIATVYSTLETDAQPRHETAPIAADADASGIAESYSDAYPGYPIHVQVIQGRPQPTALPAWSSAGIRVAWKRTTCNPRVRLILKAAVAAAAVIPLVLLFQTTNTASGITLGQMFKAFEKAQNIHVSTFSPSTGRLMQEYWISRATNSLLTTEGQGRALYDLGTRKKRVYRPSGMSADATELTESQCVNVRRTIDRCLGFTLSDIPADRKWSRTADKTDAFETYELAYTERDRSGRTALRRLRILVDPLTKLPRGVQSFRRIPSENEWHHLWREEIRYLTQDELAATISSR